MWTSNQLKSLAKIGCTVTVMLAASACSHEQLKDEAQVSAIEETSTDFASPTPDLDAAPTPIPGDDATTPVPSAPRKHVRHAKATHAKKASLKAKHKAARKVSKRRKHAKTLVAGAGRVGPAVPPSNPPPALETTPAAQDVSLPAPPPAETDLNVANEDASNAPLTLALVIAALGGLAFAGYRLRKARGSRRLVFT